MKKLCTVILALALVVGIPACCTGFYVIKDIQSINFFDWTGSVGIQNQTFEGDTLALEVQFGTELFTDGFEGTMSSMWAFSCDRRTANRIIDFDVTSTSEFHSIPAGQSLRSTFLLSNIFENTLERPEEFNFNLEPDFGGSSVMIVFPDTPDQPTHRFTITATDDSGNTMSFTTDSITWK